MARMMTHPRGPATIFGAYWRNSRAYRFSGMMRLINPFAEAAPDSTAERLKVNGKDRRKMMNGGELTMNAPIPAKIMVLSILPLAKESSIDGGVA
ncbi:hypothetical protein ACG7TL_002677 [Trametes sanguinea]